MKTRYIEEIGTRVELRVFWGSNCGTNGCHDSRRFITDLPGHFLDVDKDGHAGGSVSDYPEPMWPKKCDCCGELVPEDAKRQVFNQRLYNSTNGRPEPGDLFYESWLPENMYWDNHKGPHLLLVLPNGHVFNTDARASNCTMKEDRTHRCWVKHGAEIPMDKITLDKDGHTCSAGAGSILSGDYHGFLKNGELT